MILIAEAGATKTDWVLVRGCSEIYKFRTRGLNLALVEDSDVDELLDELGKWQLLLAHDVLVLHFYSAGVVKGLTNEYFDLCLKKCFKNAEIFYESDLLAASRALFGGSSGLVAILGTGSNSAYYLDGKIINNIRSGGYILGDEGSAASLGRNFISDYIKGLLPESIQEDFERKYQLDYSQIVNNVYKKSNPSRFLASFAPYIFSLSEYPYIQELIRNNLSSFIERVILRYNCDLNIGVVGSFGYASSAYLLELGKKYNINFVKFLSSPIDALVEYHIMGTSKNSPSLKFRNV